MDLARMSWALWLAAPVAGTVLAALWVWARGRAEARAGRPRDTGAAMRQHRAYLEALATRDVVPARPDRAPSDAG